ncbi:MAG: hypothetical protein MI919_35025, partial [Holophagales bacterium]|nr:hypothetical protein [Holophagales bacterium]
LLEPFDTEVRLGEQRVDPREPVLVLAGTHVVRLSRPGHAPVDRQLEVAAGRSITLELELARSSPVLRLNTRPRGARVLLDGEARGITEGTADESFLPQGSTGVYRREEFSEELVIDGLEPGLRVLEVAKEGFRPYRMELQIQEMIDYQMPPIVLEPESGQLVFVSFPRDGQILVDGRAARPDVPGASRPRLTLAPGSYRVTVMAGGAARMFSTQLELSDRQTMEVEVRLRPGLVLAGVLGGEEGRAANVAQSLAARLGESKTWSVIDRIDTAAEALSLLSLDAERLRVEGNAGSDAPSGLDWRQVQRTLDQQAPGLLYVLAVLDNELLATRADLWIWPAGPGPAVPDRL